jgi:flagellum-specific ATP synthase
VTGPDQAALMRLARRLLAARNDVRELVEIGAYVAGTNPDADRALALWPALERFLQQGLHEQTTANDAWSALRAALGEDVS